MNRNRGVSKAAVLRLFGWVATADAYHAMRDADDRERAAIAALTGAEPCASAVATVPATAQPRPRSCSTCGTEAAWGFVDGLGWRLFELDEAAGRVALVRTRRPINGWLAVDACQADRAAEDGHRVAAGRWRLHECRRGQPAAV